MVVPDHFEEMTEQEIYQWLIDYGYTPGAARYVTDILMKEKEGLEDGRDNRN